MRDHPLSGVFFFPFLKCLFAFFGFIISHLPISCIIKPQKGYFQTKKAVIYSIVRVY